MNRWLRRWYPHRSPDRHYEPMMPTSPTCLATNRTFLQDAIGHHMAAVMISQQLLIRGLAETPRGEPPDADHPQRPARGDLPNDGLAPRLVPPDLARSMAGPALDRGWDNTTPGGPWGQMGPGMMGQ
jgi:hypothetical protein